MKSHVRGLVLAISCLILLILGGAGGSSASTAKNCSSPDPQGRLVCVTVEDSDDVSGLHGPSPSGLFGSGARQVTVTAYQYYKLTVENSGGSTLTQGSVTVDLTDVTPDGTVVSTAAYRPSNSAASCLLVSASPNRVKCTLANIPANSSAPLIVLAYRTSTTPGVTATIASITTAFKEGTNPNGANPSTFTFTETTNLEPDHEASAAWSPPGQTTSLGTDPVFDSQFSTLQYTVPPGHAAFTATMNESNGTQCSPDLHQCFGELVTTDLSAADPGTFDGTHLFHLVLTMDYALFPGGSTNSIVLTHQPDTGPLQVIRNRCSSEPPSSTEVPCITVGVIGHGQSKLLVIGVWGDQNGGWQAGLS